MGVSVRREIEGVKGEIGQVNEEGSEKRRGSVHAWHQESRQWPWFPRVGPSCLSPTLHLSLAQADIRSPVQMNGFEVLQSVEGIALEYRTGAIVGF
ncbi:hypothetical protein FKM82_013194 [Ascaphus truei]